MPGPTEPRPAPASIGLPLALVAAGTAVFGWLNVHNASQMSPHWGQDLAFFHQLVHSAATGGPWASPLILEPQGFLEMVHTHLVLPLVVGAYGLFPAQDTLLWLHAGFAALTLWPAYRLGEACGGERHGLLCVLAVAAFGPFQAVATADFRPVVLFVPGLLGVLASARRDRLWPMLGWAAVAMAGRQEAAYLLAAIGIALVLVPWGGARRRLGLVLITVGVASFCIWALAKPQMFFHVSPTADLRIPTSGELWLDRGEFGIRLLASGWLLGLLSPGALVAGLPSIGGMLTSGHEWHRLVGPGVHHHAFWLPFVLASGIAGAARVPRGVGPLVLVAMSALAFPWATPRSGPTHLEALVERVPPDARVAADYDSIHRLAGRTVLWNIEQLHSDERPVHWSAAWPLTVDDVDWILMPTQHRLADRLSTWVVAGSAGQHVLLHRAAAPTH